MRIETRSSRAAALEAPHPLRSWKPWALALLALSLGLLLSPPGFLREAYSRQAREWGHSAQRSPSLTELTRAGLAARWRRLSGDGPPIPRLTIDVPFEEMRRVYAIREEALARRQPIQRDDHFVRGRIRHAKGSTRIRLRLKGDWTDHLEGRKWSFRIHVRGDEQLLGMRKFSIQAPSTRAYQTEPIYLSALQRAGVLAPRYSFAEVVLNGDSMGLMAIEEFFAKELLESQRRRDGVIVRYDESLCWAAKGPILGWEGILDDYRNTPVDSFGSSRIDRTPSLKRQEALALGLLRGFARASLPASEVFDVALMGRYLAISEVFGASHATRWHNQRFYLNPITLRLEPIGFDAMLRPPLPAERSIAEDEPLVEDLLADPEVFRAYRDELEALESSMADGSFVAGLQEEEAAVLGLLRDEFFLLEEYPWELLRERHAVALARLGPPKAQPPEVPSLRPVQQGLYPRLLHSAWIRSEQRLEVRNAVDWEVELQAVAWVRPETAPSRAVRRDTLPVHFPARRLRAPAEVRGLSLLPPPHPEARLLVVARARGAEWEDLQLVEEGAAAISRHPLSSPDWDRQLELHDFLEENAAGWAIKPGEWILRRPLLVPPGVLLQAGAGTRLRFSPTSPLLVRGSLRFAGTPSEPVILSAESPGSTWPGVVVLGPGDSSTWSQVVVHDTAGIDEGAWTLPGGITFHEHDLRFEGVRLVGSQAPDALNLVASSFALSQLEIREAAGDAIDSDFSEGTLRELQCREVGGDGLDLSGSRIELVEGRFDTIQDKALSVGEGSTLRARGLSIATVGMGIASKDGSHAELSDSTIAGASVAAFLAYVKKPEYGPASLTVRNVEVATSAALAWAQDGSVIVIDDEEVPTRALDVDALYATSERRTVAP